MPEVAARLAVTRTTAESLLARARVTMRTLLGTLAATVLVFGRTVITRAGRYVTAQPVMLASTSAVAVLVTVGTLLVPAVANGTGLTTPANDQLTAAGPARPTVSTTSAEGAPRQQDLPPAAAPVPRLESTSAAAAPGPPPSSSLPALPPAPVVTLPVTAPARATVVGTVMPSAVVPVQPDVATDVAPAPGL
ncbi:hypothetical protein [Amycolatopsis sp.]|uniref:hypothetical protein n=1 Tax=Amycolatopsis sp. TaxID=37632 RepID=UPI0039C886B3